MTEKIKKYLHALEHERNIKILLACETGSRAWGFPSPDSDFDVRVIYVHKKDWYLSLNEKKDAIDLMYENNDIDISGWEWRKSLRLLMKSNPALLERIQSPITYMADEEFVNDIMGLANDCYSKIATMHHYLSMSKKIMSEIDDSSPFKLKKFFYALRTATLCKWIIEKENIPPIEFSKAYRNLGLDENIVQRIEELIEIKSEKSEAYFHKDEPLLMEFIRNSLSIADEYKSNLSAGKGSMSNMNLALRKYIDKYDH